MNDIDVAELASNMDEHLDDYLMFHDLCRSKNHIYEDEIPMLWETWCTKQRR